MMATGCYAAWTASGCRGWGVPRDGARGGAAPLGHCLRRLLPGLAHKIAARHQIDLRLLRGPDRRRAVSAARRALARAAVVERGIRPVEVSRYLGVSRAAITAQLRTHDT